ncbi:hypothetical protein BJ508DRAFT_87958 [Ascobolus immersus RN42]|uniref:Uncharacterized protein n=1 Tax=Ascobolus immersus RN42 TaxID=1160509 RepID=A0A3N4HB08_ASCIM|nr:hypothetical protein BJ508DRAFT_87958 [Ascobolus immersus RN42]
MVFLKVALLVFVWLAGARVRFLSFYTFSSPKLTGLLYYFRSLLLSPTLAFIGSFCLFVEGGGLIR